MYEFTFEARLWRYQGGEGDDSSWHFVTLPKKQCQEIRALTAGRSKAFGTVRVSACVGRSRWKTSIFVDTKRDAYLLPVKAEIRKREQLQEGMPVEVLLLLLDLMPSA